MAGIPPKRGEVFYWETELTSQANTNIFQVNPTLAPGDVIVYQDGVLDGNIDTLPTAIGASATIACQLSIAEMTADRIKVRFHDVAGAQWQDQAWEFFTALKDMDDVATQAEILSDGIPFAGANVDAAISTRSTLTAAQVWAYGARTLTSFGTLVADTVTAILASTLVTNIWTYATRTLTQSAAQVAAVVAGSTVTVPPYTTRIINLTGLGSIADRAQLYATFKESSQVDTDANALIQVEETIGLVIANKAPAPNPTLASIVVTDAAAGDITITVDESVTGFPVRLGMGYDIKKITVGGDAILMTIGTFNISDIVTRRI